MGEQEDLALSLANKIAAAQLEKVELEVKTLKRENASIWMAIKLVPVITTFVAVAGLAFTFWQSQITQFEQSKERQAKILNEQQDRINRIQGQIRADQAQLIEFGSNKDMSSLTTDFLTDDLRSLVNELPDGRPQDASIGERLGRIKWYLRFDEKRHFEFDVTTLRRWNLHRQHWKDYPGSHHLFLSTKYYANMARLQPCFEKLNYAEGTEILNFQETPKVCNQELISAMIYAFCEHLSVAKETGESQLRREITEFGRITNNSAFAQRLSTAYLSEITQGVH